MHHCLYRRSPSPRVLHRKLGRHDVQAGCKSRRACVACYGAVFSATITVFEPVGTPATVSAFTPRLEVHAFPTARSQHPNVFALLNRSRDDGTLRLILAYLHPNAFHSPFLPSAIRHLRQLAQVPQLRILATRPLCLPCALNDSEEGEKNAEASAQRGASTMSTASAPEGFAVPRSLLRTPIPATAGAARSRYRMVARPVLASRGRDSHYTGDNEVERHRRGRDQAPVALAREPQDERHRVRVEHRFTTASITLASAIVVCQEALLSDGSHLAGVLALRFSP
ncbi:uncharacterized protein PHACADRAFT_206302 [Phanerochaete carnosa HHB-10118-sp]|uniref:Uncharacterized protein n=1 Tax=Phanerochaete carnosa (strain HHB-10118-sp) TaxID=650164 RepID=K5WL06_PHACS|nr:uncharacterized protein PHACADRAFT_206302 [Phanerochaete carnosa HHB-10118-sp]EKM60105.1 hypothetical protein PHACADRAFT_206302 [Phanerochaete carnosa HHB-10118-sp]